MQTIHLKADNLVITELLKIVNNFNEVGKEIEIIDNKTFDLEHNMINQALEEEEISKTHTHDEVWKELLEK